jgi:hypothetical protein
VFVPVLSAGFVDSEYCRRELDAFFDKYGGSVSADHKGRITPVELLLEASSHPDLKHFQAARFFAASGEVKREYRRNTSAYESAIAHLAAAIKTILESDGEGASAAPLAGPAGISFIADCVLDESSVKAAFAGDVPKIQFHPAILAEVKRIEDWWANFDIKSKIFPWGADNPAFRQIDLTRTRARLNEHRDKIRNQIAGASAAISETLERTADASRDLREASLAQLARFKALQIIRLIQFTDAYLPDEGPAPHTSFPTLPRIPSWLVDLIPTRSAIGELVFKEDQFLLARVGADEAEYETLVVPRRIGEYLHRSMSVGDETTFYKWVLPQWIHYRFERPLPSQNAWRIWTLKDDLNRECYLSSSSRPWEER